MTVPDRVHNLILPAIMIGIVGVFTMTTGAFTLWVGLAWGAFVALVAALAILLWANKNDDGWGFVFGVIAIPAWVGLFAGVIGGGIVRLFL